MLLAAGTGKRLATSSDTRPPKCLLRFGGKSLLQRHLEILSHYGIAEVCIAVGHQADRIEAELGGLDAHPWARTVYNPHYEQGSMVSLGCLRDELVRGEDVLLMDADVLYDHRMLGRLLASRYSDCLLLDRHFEAGAEPVKICVRAGAPVEFRKRIAADQIYDYWGESVGFFRFSEEVARGLADTTQAYLGAGRTQEPHEEALRDLLLGSPPSSFGFEDITGLPWIEIDFPEDVRRAKSEVLPRLVELDADAASYGDAR